MTDFPGNLLPRDGAVTYHAAAFDPMEASRFFESLVVGIAWQHDEVTMFGKRIVTARRVAWYGDHGFAYKYSGSTKVALPWTRDLMEMKNRVENLSGEVFNSCLLNLYDDGGQGMGWHSDDESTLVPDAAIASVSLGAERKFVFKHRGTGETISIMLGHGSLLVMAGATQRHWVHSLPKSKRITAPRVNLTFRKMKDQGSAGMSSHRRSAQL